MGGNARPNHQHDHWHADPGVRLLLVALAIVLAVFVISMVVTSEIAAAVLPVL